MSIKALQDYTFYAKYAKYDSSKKRRETWQETVDRVFSMHETKFADIISQSPELKQEIAFVKEQVLKKRVLGAQRGLQFGGEPILRKNEKIYNCSVTYLDRPRAFQEIMFLLLCGCGVGFSVQKLHTDKLPGILRRYENEKVFQIPDSIEGWADAIGVLVNSYFQNKDNQYPEYQNYKVKFDTSLIRPEGAPISGGFKAPGPAGLEAALIKIENLIEARLDNGENRLHPIDAYDIIMHASDAVLSGGVRRSATICLFSKDDEEMIKAKTGDWFIKNPQRGRSNNSVLLIKNKTTREEFANIMNSVREFGEPGFVWADNEDVLYNPCVEIGMRPQTKSGVSGVQFCNLCEINGKKIKSKEDFLQAARAAAILGTLQAAYTDFPYLGKDTEEIVRDEALLGVSITGMMDSPDIIFNPDYQKEAAKEVLRVNEIISKLIGINPCARATCVKPAGSTSCILGTSSGIHAHHAKRYIRIVQANHLEFPLKHFASINPLAVEKSVWSNNGTDYVIRFLCEVPQGSVVKNQMRAIDLLDHVKLTQQNWVEYGTRPDRCSAEYLRHNVSNTITVKENEWDEVENYIYNNRQWFAGISLLPFSGDKDYPQAPFTAIYTPKEIVEMYGNASVFASGLIVDGLKAFEDNLWKACSCALGTGEKLPDISEPVKPQEPVKNGYSDKAYIKKLKEYTINLYAYLDDSEKYEINEEKKDWIRRANQFADRYFDGDLRKMTYCLKDAYNWKIWCDLSREYKDIDWSEVVEEVEYVVAADTTAGASCSGGACEII